MNFDWDKYDRHVDELIAEPVLRDGLKQEARIRADAELALIAAGHPDWREEFGLPNTRAFRSDPKNDETPHQAGLRTLRER